MLPLPNNARHACHWRRSSRGLKPLWYNGVPPSGYPMEQVKQDPHNVDRVIARQMPYLTLIPLPVKTGWMSHPRALPCLPASRSCGPHANSAPRRRQTRCARCWTSDHDASADLCAMGHEL